MTASTNTSVKESANEIRETVKRILKGVSLYWSYNGTITVFGAEEDKHWVEFKTCARFSSVSFCVGEYHTDVLISGSVCLGKTGVLQAHEFFKRASVLMELMEVVPGFTAEHSFNAYGSTSVVMRRKYEGSISEGDLEVLLVLIKRYFDKAERVLKEAGS